MTPDIETIAAFASQIPMGTILVMEGGDVEIETKGDQGEAGFRAVAAMPGATVSYTITPDGKASQMATANHLGCVWWAVWSLGVAP